LTQRAETADYSANLADAEKDDSEEGGFAAWFARIRALQQTEEGETEYARYGAKGQGSVGEETPAGEVGIEVAEERRGEQGDKL